MTKNIYSDNLLFALSKGDSDKDNEYEFYYFYYKDRDSLNKAFAAIYQIVKDTASEDDNEVFNVSCELLKNKEIVNMKGESSIM